MVINSTIGHQHESKKCTSASCCSIHKIWKAIQNIIATGDKQAWKQLSQDPDRIAHVKHALLSSRAHNDVSMYPASHKHKVLQFDKHLRAEATRYFGKAVTDLNALQVALFHHNEAMACSLVTFLRQHAEPSELQSFLNHVWGERNTSLHLACFYGMPRLVRMLLDIGVSPDAVNARQLKPADCCKHPGCLASLKLKSTADAAPSPPPRRQSLKPKSISPTPAPLKRRASLPTLKDGIKRSNATVPARTIKSAPPSPTTPVTRRPVWATTTTTKTNSNVKSTQQRRVVPTTATNKKSTGVMHIKKPVANDKPSDPVPLSLKQKPRSPPVIVQPKEKESTPVQSPTPVAKHEMATKVTKPSPSIVSSPPASSLDIKAVLTDTTASFSTALPENITLNKSTLESTKDDPGSSIAQEDESPPLAATTLSRQQSSCTSDTNYPLIYMGHDPLSRKVERTLITKPPPLPGIHALFDHDPAWVLPVASLYLQVAIACFHPRLEPRHHNHHQYLMRTCHSADMTMTTAFDVHEGHPMVVL